MHQFIGRICEVVAVLATLSGFGYALISLWGAMRFVKENGSAAHSSLSLFMPPVSILKPLKGTDPKMYESFSSHCLLEYPEYEIIFGVSDAKDPAIRFVDKLKAAFPERAIRLVICRESLGTNVKVSNLAQMFREAQYEHLIVNDSDIRVQPDYLRRVVSPLHDPKVGLVTCLYRAIPSPTLGSRLEALGIIDFAAGVLAARQLEGGTRFGLGSTLAFRRSDLSSVGGFEAFSDYLADDYQLGVRLTSHELAGKLSSSVVETHLPPYGFKEFLMHQLRWARTVRDSRPLGYVGLALTYYLVWALLAVICSSGATWAWALLATAVALRMTSTMVVGRLVLSDPETLPLLALNLLRDILALLVWIVGFVGHRVIWRGESFILKNGKLIRLPLEHTSPLQ